MLTSGFASASDDSYVVSRQPPGVTDLLKTEINFDLNDNYNKH